MPDIFDQIAAPQAAPPGGDIFDQLAPDRPTAKRDIGPTFSAPAKLPWYSELLDRLGNVIAGPGAVLNDTLGHALNRAEPNLNFREPGINKPILDLSALKAETLVPGSGTPSDIARGVVKGAESFGGGLTTPANAAIIGTTAGMGEALPVVSRLLATGFSLQMLRDAFERSPQFAEQVQSGKYEDAARTLTEIGLTAAAGVTAAKHAANPEGLISPEKLSRETIIRNSPGRNATSQRPTDEALAQILKVEPPGPKRDALMQDAASRGITAPEIESRGQQVTETLKPVAEQDAEYTRLFDEAERKLKQTTRKGTQQPQNAPSPRKAAEKPTVPEEGPPEQVTRAQYARENLARQLEGKGFSELPNSSRLAIDDLIAQGYGQVGEPPTTEAKTPGVETKSADSETIPPDSETKTSAQAEKEEVAPERHLPAREPGKPVVYGRNAEIKVPGESRTYDAVYSVREASDVYPSHNPFSFEPNPDYHHVNDRNYSEPRNAERVVKQAAEFDPEFHINDNPDATNGPPILDHAGNVLGGNSRTMTLARVRSGNLEAAANYRRMLEQNAKRFGIAPERFRDMEHPTLTREVLSPHDPQRAITDFNKTGTAELATAERAITDSKRLSQHTADYLASRIEEQGPNGTLAQALEGSGGRDIVNRLVDDGVITTQEKPKLLNADGSMTPEGKTRISRLMSGRFFNDATELEAAPADLRAKLDRVVAPLARLAGREDWDLTPAVKEAVSLVRDAQAHGQPVDDLVRQNGLFGGSDYSGEAVAIARKLEGKPTEIARAFRQYANDEALSRPDAPMTMGFDPPTREDAFQAAFGESAKPADNTISQSKEVHAAEAFSARPSSGTRSRQVQERNPSPPATQSRAPTGPQVATGLARYKDAILRLIAPAARSEGARATALEVRQMGADLANRLHQATVALKEARGYFASRPTAANYDFINRVETGKPQTTLQDQQIANTMRQMMDSARDQVRALGTHALQTYYENYFPHIWEQPQKARDFVTQFLEKRPLQGSKAFTKQRTLPTFADGIAAGLKPVSENPVDLVLGKIHEMNKYLLAHQAMAELKERGLVEYFPATEKAPMGKQRINDSIATVYGKPTVTVHESFDEPLMKGLEKFAESIGVSHERMVKLKGRGVPPTAEGYTTRGGDVFTKFGSPEQVLAHEIGHQIEFKFGISKALRGPGIAKELNDLAALRWEGRNPSGGYKAYARNVDEKMANAIAAMIYAPERFREVAPKTWDLLRDELHSHAPLRPLFEIRKSMTIASNEAEVPVGGMVIRGHYWAPEDRATILNNYLSPGLRGNPIYDVYMGLGNTLNQFQLGMSLFHFGTTAMESMISKDALAIRQASVGQLGNAVKSHLGGYIAPFLHYIEGNKLMKEMARPGTQGAELARMADAVIKAGGRATQDKFYDQGMATRMVDAFRRGDVAKGIALTVPGLADLSSHALMKNFVPRLKLGAFSELAQFELSRLGSDATPKDAQAALARAWDSIDNRFGQLVYDNLFWNKTVKDLSMASVRAVGWTLGSLREGLGGAADTAENVKKLASGDQDAEITNRMAYIPAMILRTGLMGGATYYLLTGKTPEKLRDFFFPLHHSMPGFLKDAVNWGTHPADTAKGKIHPAATLLWDVLNNEDFYNHPIAPPEHKALKRAWDYAKFIGEQFVPIGLRDAIKGKDPRKGDPFQFIGMPKEPPAVRDRRPGSY
jgi:hypothetical protein